MPKICIDAGHGGHDPGAVNGSIYEKNIALSIALLLDEKLRKQGFNTVLTRNNDEFIELTDRCKIANKNKCDLFISIHLNAGNSAASGIETLVYKNSGVNSAVAKHIQTRLIDSTGANDRGIKERPDLCVLRETSMPAVLIETGFISNAVELKRLSSVAYQNKIATLIAKSLCAHYGTVYIDNEVNMVEEKRYNSINEIPESLRSEIQELVNCGALKGDGKGFDLSYDMIRILVIAKRYLDLQSNKK